MSASLLIALPCYNEAANLPALLDRFVDLNVVAAPMLTARVLVIDDGSTDETAAVAEPYRSRLPLVVHRHPRNLGLRGALRTAVRLFDEDRRGADPATAYGLMDGDDSHSPMALPTMLQRLLEGHDVVVASRFRPYSRTMGVPRSRQVLSAGMALLFKTFRNIPGVRDYSCGYRLYAPSLVADLWRTHGEEVVTEASFACMVELLVRCDALGAVMTEVPFTLRYDRKRSVSKMPVRRTVAGTLRVLRR